MFLSLLGLVDEVMVLLGKPSVQVRGRCSSLGGVQGARWRQGEAPSFTGHVTPGQCPALLETRGAEGSGPHLPAVKSVIGALLTSAGGGRGPGRFLSEMGLVPPSR